MRIETIALDMVHDRNIEVIVRISATVRPSFTRSRIGWKEYVLYALLILITAVVAMYVVGMHTLVYHWNSVSY